MTSHSQPLHSKVDFTVVISCYQEEDNIQEFYDRLASTIDQIDHTFEIIFVNDGSTDGTQAILERIFESDSRVVAVVDFMKNAGQSAAKTPGVLLGRGKAFVLIDSDLQLDPEDLPKLVAEYERGADIVTGYRENRRDPWSRKLPSLIANIIMRKAARANLKDFGCTYKIYDGRLVRAFEFGPFNPWRPVPVTAQAQRIAEVPVNHHPRKYGKSGWTFRKLFAYNMENIVTMSERPFQLLSALCALASGLFLLRIAVAWALPFKIVPRVTEGLVLNVGVMCFFILLAVLCGVGEFVIRNFVAHQRRPAYIIRNLSTRIADPDE